MKIQNLRDFNQSKISTVIWIYLAAFILMTWSFNAHSKTPVIPKSKTQKTKQTNTSKGIPMYAIFETSQGNFKIKLFADKAPKTVENFVGLAEGTKEFTDAKTEKKVTTE